MKTTKIKCIKNEKIKIKKPEPPKTSDNMIKLHSLCAFIGHRNSGKTNAAILLAKKLKDEALTRIFVISPTFHANPIFTILNIDEDDIYTDTDNVFNDLNDMQDKIKDDYDDYNEYNEYKKLVTKFLKYSEEALTYDEILLLEKYNYQLPVDKWNNRKPCYLLIIDDCSHSPIYRAGRNPFINLALRHRHLNGCGISIFMLVQNWKSSIPKTVRQNLTQVAIYATHDQTQLDGIYEELLANMLKKDQFMKLYNYATKDDHQFLFIDLDAKTKAKRFRKNFDELLQLNELSKP